jgi:hypothetical protein
MMRAFVGVLAVLAVVGTVSAQRTYLYNGGFSAGVLPYCDPADWGVGELDPGTGMQRDTAVYHSAPASLEVIRSVTGAGGHITQRLQLLPASAGSTFNWSAWVLVDSSLGGTAWLVAHFSCGTYWTECTSGGWVTLNRESAATAGWKQVSGTATVPTGAVWGLIRIYTTDIIGYHVDDISIAGQAEVINTPDQCGASSIRLRSPQSTAREGNVLNRADLLTGQMSVYLPNGRLATKAGVRSLPTGCYLVRVAKAGQQNVVKMHVAK